VAAFKAELNTANNTACISCGRMTDVGANVSAFLARKKEEVTAIAKMSLTRVDVKASTIIVYSSMHSSVQNGIKTALLLVARNYLTPGSNASKSTRYIPESARLGIGGET
jgi:predicted methyltransferase MtxX (methanogen marker protein 4)